jgi:glycosyltransferase involved in cell wall biosynthesis
MLLTVGVWPFIGRWVLLSDAIVCISEGQRKVLATRMPSLIRKSRLIYNPLPEVTAIGIDGDEFGYFGGPNPLKGHDVIVRASDLTRSPTIVRATSFGHDVTRSFHNGSRILYSRRLSEPQYKRMLQNIRTVIVPSIWAEPLPYVVSEAILRGKLVIASDVGGIPEQTSQCPGAFLVPPMNEETLAELMDYVSSLDAEEASDLAAKSRETLVKKFDNSIAIGQFVSLLRELT